MNIVKEYNTFDLERITLENPIRVNGGGYYSKLLISNNHTNNLFIETPSSVIKNEDLSKFSDLIFKKTQKDTSFISFIERFESKIKSLIHDKSSEWFDNKMDLSDINYFFNSSSREYGEDCMLFRAYIDKKTNIEGVDRKYVKPILEFRGIKFTNSSFHIDVIIKEFGRKTIEMNSAILKNREIIETVDVEPLDDDVVTLRKPNDIYMEIYQEAKDKARDAKKKAVIAYLEAKDIKNTYMIDSLDDSTSDEEELDNLSDNTDISYQDLL